MRKTAIITGASRGIGRACAFELAQIFDRIVINSFSHPDELSAVRDEIAASGTDCLAYTGDIGDPEFVSHMIQEVLAGGPPVDLLVNNAGISYVGLLTDMSYEDWSRIITTNLTSVFNTCHAVIPDMVKRQSGHIINISSMWGISGASCEVAYSATKGGMNAFTKALAKELAPSRIRVNALACGAIDTSMNACFSTEELQTLCEEIPACRLGTPEEVACTVRHLYEMPAYVTGEVLRVDGGYL